MSPLVELVGVSKGYGGVQALDGVSFAIERGAVAAAARSLPKAYGISCWGM